MLGLSARVAALGVHLLSKACPTSQHKLQDIQPGSRDLLNLFGSPSLGLIIGHRQLEVDCEH